MNVGANLGHAFGVPDSFFPQFEVYATGCENSKILWYVIARQRVENHINPAPVSELQNFAAIFEVSRIHHVLNSKGTEQGTFLLVAGGRKDLGAQTPGFCYRG